MKFKVERNFLVRTEEVIELVPNNFLHCATIEELFEEVEEQIESMCKHPTAYGLQSSEEIGVRYYDNWFSEDNGKSFFIEWQKLKELPQEL